MPAKYSWPWRDWYRQYLDSGYLPNEAGNALIILFRSLVKRYYPAKYFSPERVSFEWGGVVEERYIWFHQDGQLGEAAQDIICDTLKAWLRSREFQENFELRQWTDKQVHFYVRSIMKQKILHARRSLKPTAWWWMYRSVRNVIQRHLYCLSVCRQLYVPVKWLKSRVPPEKDFVELEKALNSLPKWKGEVPARLDTEVLWRKVVEKIFSHVGAPVPLSELVTHSLKMLGIDPNYPVPFESTAAAGGEFDCNTSETDPKGPEFVAEVEVRSWVRSVLSCVDFEHLVVIKLHTCDELTFQEISEQSVRFLGRKLALQTVHLRYQQSVERFRRPLGKDNKFIVTGLPTSATEQTIFCKILCSALNERLEEILGDGSD